MSTLILDQAPPPPEQPKLQRTKNLSIGAVVSLFGFLVLGVGVAQAAFAHHGEITGNLGACLADADSVTVDYTARSWTAGDRGFNHHVTIQYQFTRDTTVLSDWLEGPAFSFFWSRQAREAAASGTLLPGGNVAQYSASNSQGFSPDYVNAELTVNPPEGANRLLLRVFENNRWGMNRQYNRTGEGGYNQGIPRSQYWGIVDLDDPDPCGPFDPEVECETGESGVLDSYGRTVGCAPPACVDGDATDVHDTGDNGVGDTCVAPEADCGDDRVGVEDEYGRTVECVDPPQPTVVTSTTSTTVEPTTTTVEPTTTTTTAPPTTTTAKPTTTTSTTQPPTTTTTQPPTTTTTQPPTTTTTAPPTTTAEPTTTTTQPPATPSTTAPATTSTTQPGVTTTQPDVTTTTVAAQQAAPTTSTTTTTVPEDPDPDVLFDEETGTVDTNPETTPEDSAGDPVVLETEVLGDEATWQPSIENDTGLDGPITLPVTGRNSFLTAYAGAGMMLVGAALTMAARAAAKEQLRA